MNNENDETKKVESVRRGPFVPPRAIPDTLVVPDKTIYLVPDQKEFLHEQYFEKCSSKRAWFTSFFYNCLPIVFGNQHGFILKATHSFVIRWTGSDSPNGLLVHRLTEETKRGDLLISSHFGHGIVTVQSRQYFRTPKGVNMMVKAPPNYPVDALSWMDAVVETDNLRRDFTFNIKVTRANKDIYIEAGTPLGCIVPYPRFFLDGFELVALEDPDELDKAVETAANYAIERGEYDADKPRLRYMEGKDIYNFFYDEHQKTLDNGAWWNSSDAKVERRDSARCPVTHQAPPTVDSNEQAVIAESERQPVPEVNSAVGKIIELSPDVDPSDVGQ